MCFARLGLLALVLMTSQTACSAGDDGGELDPDGGNEGDASLNCSSAPILQPPWLLDFQDEVVAKLSGAQEIVPGEMLSDRASPARRGLAQTYIEAELSEMGYQAQRDAYGNGTNVFAELDGSADSIYVLGAHYDSVASSPGANDNATGVAAVLAAARFLREHECRVHGVVFVFFDQEEIGLIGSAAFAQKLQLEGRDVRGVYTLDQLGWDMDQDRRIEIEIPSPGMFVQVQSTITRHGLGIPIAQTDTAGSDHSAFRQLGFPALGITEEYVNGDTTPHYHLPSDTYATVDFGFLASATALVNALVFDLSTEG